MHQVYPMRACLIIVLIAATSVLSQSERLSVAVSDLEPHAVDKASAAIITDRLRSEMVNTGRFRVMERGEMEAVLSEQGFQQSGACSDQACLVEVGQLLGVSHVVAGTIGKVGRLFTLSLRIIDVRTGEIVRVVSEDCDCAIEDVLSSSTGKIARRLAAAVGGEPEQPAAAESEGRATGLVSVVTRPEGASVSTGGEELGRTPLSEVPVPAGDRTFRLTLEGYRPVDTSLTVTAGEAVSFERTLSAVKNRTGGKRRGSRPRRIVFGVLAGSLGALGVVADRKVLAPKVQEQKRLREIYDHAGPNADFDRIVSEYDDATGKAQQAKMIRNGLYGLSALSTIGFGISFAF